MSSLVLKNGYILTLDEDDTILESGDVLIEGDQVKQIAASIDPHQVNADRVIDASHMLVMPGLINAHVHSYENLFRGIGPSLPNELWNLRVYPPVGGIKFTPRLYYLRAMLGALEMVKGGVTTIQDNSKGWFSSGDPEVESAYWSAYRDLGVRICVAVGLLDRTWLESIPYLQELLPPDLARRLAEETALAWAPQPAQKLIADCEAVIKKWHQPSGRFTISVAPLTPQGCSDELMVLCMELAEKYDLTFHIHVLETRIQRLLARRLYGTSTVRYLHALGLLRPRMSMVHAIWVTDDDIQLMADNDCCVIHCPLSNLRMGSGITPLSKLRNVGIAVGLGSDGTACNDTQSMFDVMRFAALSHNIPELDFRKWPTSDQILRMATSVNAHCMLAQDQLGSLTPGKRADVILLDLRDIGFTPLHNVKNQLVFSQNGGAVKTVIVDGEVIVENGRVLTVNEGALLEELRSYMPMLKEQYEKTQPLSDEIWPYLEQVYQKAVDQSQ